MRKLSEHFYQDEFACKCGKCGLYEVNPKLIIMLENIRALLHEPMIIISGRRCEAHNRMVGGALHSQHVLGKATDFRISGHDGVTSLAIKSLLLKSKISELGGIGTYNTFVHVDVREKKAGHIAQWSGIK